jgi:O-antigen ligase
MHIALDLLSRHPVTGVGLGGYGRYADEPPLISSSVSTFLTVGAETGVLGLALLLAAILTTTVAGARSVFSSSSTERAMLGGLVAAFVALAAANAVGEVWMNDFQWTLFGVVLAVTRQARITALPRSLRKGRKVHAGVSDGQAKRVRWIG